ncbi:MAG TPA: aminotransferase class V-fold PLP-dependent enzyme [Vicinamibacterales bacterium]|nr:aminotransferase class V-fold PLP-dependent enzyme [Vicinamibacterales bacterium]
MTDRRFVYLDYHATTPVDPEVLDAMLPWFTERFGNAASRQYRLGWEALEAVESAREQVAALIGADAKEIVFTSGATESNNLALKGLAEACREKGSHFVTVVTEHKSVLDTLKRLEHDGYDVTYLPVANDGLVDLNRVREAVTTNTIALSVMAANNEIGVLAQLSDLAAIAHEKGALLHTDAVQAVGKVPFNVNKIGVDLASLTAHKFYGPKGVGALYVRRRPRRVSVTPLLDGGGHERGMRSGTLNVPGIVGLGAAASMAAKVLTEESTRLKRLRDRLLKGLQARVPDLVLNGSMQARLPGNLNVSFPGVDGEALLVSLSDDLAVSSGAACTAAEPSYVLKALGRKTELALATLRFGLGRWTTEEDVNFAVARAGEVVTRLRAMSPV